MKNRAAYPFAIAVTLLCLNAPTWAQSGKAVQSGEQVYQQVCVACHATGVANAPKLGDKVAWKPLIEEGQPTLTGHAWVGVRAMPAQGGATRLSLEEFARAVAWMASQSGGSWRDPDAATLKAIREQAREQLKKDLSRKQKLLADPGR